MNEEIFYSPDKEYRLISKLEGHDDDTMLDFKHVCFKVTVGHSERNLWYTVAYTWCAKFKKSS